MNLATPPDFVWKIPGERTWTNFQRVSGGREYILGTSRGHVASEVEKLWLRLLSEFIENTEKFRSATGLGGETARSGRQAAEGVESTTALRCLGC